MFCYIKNSIVIIQLQIGYKNKSDKQYKKIHSLVGTSIKDNIKEIVHENMSLYPFSLYLLQKHRTFYATNMTEKIVWVQALKYALGYSNFNDYYQFTKVIGKGKFGLVRLAIHILCSTAGKLLSASRIYQHRN